MEKIKSFSKTNLQLLRATLLKEFAERAKEVGLDMQFGSIGFNAGEANMKVTMKTLDPEVRGAADEREVKFANMYLEPYGLKVGQSFQATHKGRKLQLTIAGYNTRAKSMPVKLIASTGESLKAPISYVTALVK